MVDELRRLREQEMNRIWKERGIARAYLQQALTIVWGNHIEGFPQYEPEVKDRLERATTMVWRAMDELDRSEELKEIEKELEGKGWKP